MANVMVTSVVGSVPTVPGRRRQRDSVPSRKHLLSKISFSGYWLADRHYVMWLEKMEALHGETWRKAGIYDAVKASAYTIRKDPSLVLSVAENWCSETNTFVFPWGEATITLEDVMVLLGFSVLGSHAFAPLESWEMRDSADKLHKVRKQLISSGGGGGGVRKSSWTAHFFGNGDQMEHEAFLVLWLSFFAFPGKSTRAISKKVIPIAVRLARGERIALAPAVLASVYRDLGRIRDLAKGGMYDGDKVNLKSLLKLVQVWTWERFQNVRPKARVAPEGEPRIARWDMLHQNSENVRMSFDNFEWRPYTKPLRNWNPLKFYVKEGMWFIVDNTISEEFASFVRCVRASHLAGDGFVQDYNPDRVAGQFGLTQDVPALLTHPIVFTEHEAWEHYSRSVAGWKLYMPSWLDRGSVNPRYRDWWLKSVSGVSSSKEVMKEPREASHARNTVDDYDERWKKRKLAIEELGTNKRSEDVGLSNDLIKRGCAVCRRCQTQ